MIPSHLKLMASYIGENFLYIKQAAITAFIVALPASASAPFWGWVEANIDYIQVVFWAVAGDHILGTIVHTWWKRDFSTIKNITGLALKLLIILLMGSLFEGLAHLTKEQDFIFTYLKAATRILVFFYPLRSAMLNSYIITQGRFPPKILIERTTKFNETMDLDILTGKKDPNSGEQIQEENNQIQ